MHMKADCEPIGKYEDGPGVLSLDSQVEVEKPPLKTEQDEKKVVPTKEEDKASLKFEEHKGSLKSEENKDSLKSEENKDSLKLEENKADIKAEFGPGAVRRASGECARSLADISEDIKSGVKEEGKGKVEMKAQAVELADTMDIDRTATAEMDDGPSDLGRTSPLATTAPSEAVPQLDDAQVPFTAEDSPLSEAPARAVSLAETVAKTTPWQHTVKEEPIEMDIDTVAISTVEQADVARENDGAADDETEGMDVDESATTTETSRPAKRRKVLMDAVVLPFVSSVRAHADAERQAIERQLEQLRNPKVKKSKDAPVLSLDTVRARLHSHNISYVPYPIDLEHDILDVTVRRDFMAQEYGGNPQETYPKIGKAFVEKTGLKYFMYLNLLHNPHCPEIPGAPGLLFDASCAEDPDSSDDEDDDEEGERGEERKSRDDGHKETEDEDKKDKPEDMGEILFARLDQAVWQYQGQYVLARADDLTIAEWKQQSPKVRKQWANQLTVKRWGRTIRADVTLRRELGRKPTKAETKAALATNDKFSDVTPEEISGAFNRGEAVIVVHTLKCVGYNVDLQRNLAAKFPFFVPNPPRPRNSNKNGGNKTGAKAKKVKSAAKAKSTTKVKSGTKASAGKRGGGDKGSPAKRGAAAGSRSLKRKRKDWDDSDVESEDDSIDWNEWQDEDEEPEDNVYRHRGTLSRPIVL